MQRSSTMRAGLDAIRWLQTHEFREVEYLVAGQVSFVLGWSLFWAAALALVTWVPIGVGLLLMALGLAAPATQRWRRRAGLAIAPGAPALIPPAAARGAHTST